VDHYTRECPVIEVDLSLPGARVVRALEQLAEERGCRKPFGSTTALNLFAMPCVRGVSGGKCFLITSSQLSPCRMDTWESFNGKFRDECLNAHSFTSLRQAKSVIEYWRDDHNDVRPHSALKYATPNEFARQGSASFAVQGLGNTGRNRVKATLAGSLRSALTRPRPRVIGT